MAIKRVVKKKVASKRASSKPVASGEVTLMANGQVISSRTVGAGDTLTIGDAAMELARSQGLKSYSVRLNGVPVNADEAKGKLAGAKSLEVFAKDTRG